MSKTETTWHLVNYADSNFKPEQQFLEKIHSENFNIISYNREWLVTTDFYKENQSILDEKHGGGWWVWKPFVILDALSKVEDGDYVLYCDCGDMVSPDIKSYVESVVSEDECCLLLLGNNTNKDYTKRDCFILMECDEADYWNSNQLEAGVSVWKKTEQSINVLSEWVKYCTDPRIIKDDPSVLGKEVSSFNAHRNDQSILTNIAIREGLGVSNHEFRNFIECDYDYWYERYLQGLVGVQKPIEAYMVQLLPDAPLFLHSIVLTVHNKDWLIGQVLDGIIKNTSGKYELIVVLDGCTDNSEQVVTDILSKTDIPHKIIHTPDVFETKANNAGLKECSGEFAIIIQDDIVIKEKDWNMRMQKPFLKYNDIFAVTANCAHNYILNTNSIHLGMEEDLDNCWCDILQCVDEANVRNIPRDTFAVRATANRGPLMINLSDLKELGYLDEEYSPQDMDDHDLMFRAYKQLGKRVGCFWIDFVEDPSWGGTRVNGEPANWLLKSHHKNSKLFYQRNKDVLDDMRIVDNRKVS